MESLWSSWRTKYIEGFKDDSNYSSCFICDGVNEKENFKEKLIIAKFNHTIVIMNRYPYNAGHLLIAPKRHIGNFEDLNDEEMLEIFKVHKLAIKALEEIMKPQGFNIGANLGRIAGAGLPEHIHFHIVPRWGGDTNFMPVLADTKVISQSLEELHSKLYEKFLEYAL